ncbi:acetyl-CoA synthetase-like protein [Melanomma pulvis-pyrius CBS 109.77]|uniref:Acetyl-CoA synthetase-like protein n=1 Tax=Melanomma pulvis-pyrius CBS 109.77 TaxID=1314802 RepID=A0A6A6XRN8_9PLEO|nr:acetyl-CoA synthetase-like protein [Melanomma pulvis-pyrius CBS 109.77]
MFTERYTFTNNMRTGQRLLPSLVDEIAQSDPHRILYSIPKSKDISGGFQDINAKVFARSVDRCSWYLETNLGHGHDFPTLTYMGPQDVVYAILILACIKTGYKLLLSSPRNTIEAHLSLLEKTDCGTFLLPPNFPLPAVKQILAARQMRVVEIPCAQHWIEDGSEEPYLYTKSFAEARSDPFVILHTSGSTGMPKPIVQTHGTLSPLDAFSKLPSLGQKPSYPAMCTGKRVYLAFPLFHCAGVSMILPGCIYGGFTVVLGPFPPSADVANAVHIYGNVQQSCLAPTTLVDLVKSPEYLKNLGRLEQVTFGGGPLPQAVGNMVASKTRLLNCLGTTECGVLPVQLCDPEDWEYMSVSSMLGHEYRHVSEDLYEQVIVRRSELEQYQGIFGTFPKLMEWPMKDLYSKHPIKENIWLYRGRADDIIVFSTGEKINPLEMENIINSNPAVNVALITGFGRFQSSLLVEAVNSPTSEAEKEGLLDTIWPSVVAANKKSPSHGLIHRNMITFTSANKPMLRAGKGTVQRMSTVDVYSTELDVLYEANVDRMKGPSNGTINSHVDPQEVVKHIIATFTNIEVAEIDTNADLFGLGLDSLQVTLITKKINEYLLENGKLECIPTKTVYSNPTIDAITTVVSALTENMAPIESGETDEEKMNNLYKLHTAGLPLSARQAQDKPLGKVVVLLTGSTGSLGSYILDTLLSDPRVSTIYCLNRGSGSHERQLKSQALKGLQTLQSKVKCIDADISKAYFGLPMHVYRDLLDRITTVIHNAWQVDFNMAVNSFNNQISTVSRFVDFSAHSKFGAQLFFVSSISAVANWNTITGSSENVPEQIYENWKIPQSMGYGQSKFVSERLLDTAAREANIPAVICRVGQIAGPTMAAGMWPRQEWLPSMIRSSKYLGMLPASLGPLEVVDWIPVDILAKGIIELATSSTAPEKTCATVYHAVNPERTSWKELLPTVARYLEPQTKISIVSLEEWVNTLRQSSSKDVVENPAIKILGFFESLVRYNTGGPVLLNTKNATNTSKTLADLVAVGEEWMENWMRQWEF